MVVHRDGSVVVHRDGSVVVHRDGSVVVHRDGSVVVHRAPGFRGVLEVHREREMLTPFLSE